MPPPGSRALLRAAGLAPKKSFGQSFLVSDAAILAIARACVPDDEIGRARVVELGAGVGALTAELLSRAERVTAIERDRDLLPVLANAFAAEIARGALLLLEQDAQKLDVAACFEGATGPRVLCGNLPYQITGKLLRLATAHAAGIDRAVFMVQREVADRLTAAPGDKDYGALTVFIRAAFEPALLRVVPPGAFHPPPRVTSAVVTLTPLRPPRAEETAAFRELVKAGFATRRKTLRNAWRALAPDLPTLEQAAARAGVSLDARAETLDVAAFARMATALHDVGSDVPLTPR